MSTLTWLFAVAVAAPIGGGAFFGGFAPWVWTSLVGHVLYGHVPSLIFHRRVA